MAAPATTHATLCALRREMARIEGRPVERLDEPASRPDAREAGDPAAPRRPGTAQSLPATGIPDLDAALGGGVPHAGLIEIHGAAMRDCAAPIGFALALSSLLRRALPGAGEKPVLWAAASTAFREGGRPYAPGLAGDFGLRPGELAIAEAGRAEDVLWIAEEAAATGAFRAIIVELPGTPAALGLTATRRLHRRGLSAGHPVFLLRHGSMARSTAAPLRLLVAPDRAAPRHTLAGPVTGSIGPPSFRVTVDKSRRPSPVTFVLEWKNDSFRQRDETAHHGDLVSLSGGRPAAPSSGGSVVAFRPADAAPDRQPPLRQHPANRRA
jgi:protein ImuA